MVPAPEIVISYKASLTFHDGSWMVPNGSDCVSKVRSVEIHTASTHLGHGSAMVPHGSDIGNSDSVEAFPYSPRWFLDGSRLV